MPEFFENGDKLYHGLLLPLFTGYIISYMFYYITVIIPRKEKEKEEQEICNSLHNILYKRLDECLLYIELHFGFSWIKGINIGDLIGSLSREKILAINNLIALLKSPELHQIYCKAHNLDNKKYSLSDSTLDLLKEKNLRIYAELESTILPQLLLIEKNNKLKQVLLKLFENISDTPFKIQEQEDMQNGAINIHLINFLQCISDIFSILLKLGEGTKFK